MTVKVVNNERPPAWRWLTQHTSKSLVGAFLTLMLGVKGPVPGREGRALLKGDALIPRPLTAKVVGRGRVCRGIADAKLCCAITADAARAQCTAGAICVRSASCRHAPPNGGFAHADRARTTLAVRYAAVFAVGQVGPVPIYFNAIAVRFVRAVRVFRALIVRGRYPVRRVCREIQIQPRQIRGRLTKTPYL